MIAAVTDQDPYAGLLVSMHGAGIYRGRYGTQPSLKLAFADEARTRSRRSSPSRRKLHARLVDQLGVPEDERWTNCRLLQVYDRLSLYFCLRDAEARQPDTLEPVPRDYEGARQPSRSSQPAPWRVTLDPYPFAESPATFRLVRRLLPKRRPRRRRLSPRFAAVVPEDVEITVEPR